jgi:hypothetical protein
MTMHFSLPPTISDRYMLLINKPLKICKGFVKVVCLECKCFVKVKKLPKVTPLDKFDGKLFYTHGKR